MANYSFEQIKSLLNTAIKQGVEAELSVYFENNPIEYMIIIYENYCSFQRCGYKDGSGEIVFDTLDEMYEAELVDNIVLSRDWDSIDEFYCLDFSYLGLW